MYNEVDNMQFVIIITEKLTPTLTRMYFCIDRAVFACGVLPCPRVLAITSDTAVPYYTLLV